MLRFIVRRHFAKEVLDYSKIPNQQSGQPVNCLVLHPVMYPNKGPEMELYMAEEAVGLAKSLFWSVTKGPFWREEYSRSIRKSQGRPEEKVPTTKADQQTTLQEMHKEGWKLVQETNIKDGEYIHIPFMSGVYNKGQMLLDLSSESDDDLAHEWRNKIIRESIAKSSLIKVPRIHSSTFFTKGKVQMLGEYVKENQINAVFVNHELTPLQTRNLEKILNSIIKGEEPNYIVNQAQPENSDLETDAQTDNEYQEVNLKVFDRYTMILQIFAKRSSQGVARLQIELSFLQFAKTKLVRSGSAFQSLTSIFLGDLMSAKEINLEVVSAKQRRAVGKTMGSGESALEIQRRLIDDKVSKVKQLLDVEIRQKSRLRQKRSVPTNVPIIALIGYTNAGKSALLNCIVQKDVVESKDLLFQTLSTTSRKIKLTSGSKGVMLDTIGFITDLPHDLVASFKTTLEEVAQADLVLHIRDISHPCSEQQKNVVLDVIQQMGLGQKFYSDKMIEVWNKIDLLRTPINYDLLEQSDYPIVPISATKKTNIQQLLSVMEDKTNQILNKKVYHFKHSQDTHWDRLKWLYEHGNISSIMNEIQSNPTRNGDPGNVEFDVLLDEVTYNRYRATYHPEEREQRKKLKGMPPSNW